MALSEMTDDLKIIQKLGTFPNSDDGLSDEALKAKFDEAGEKIQNYLNEKVVPAVNDANRPFILILVTRNEDGSYSTNGYTAKDIQYALHRRMPVTCYWYDQGVMANLTQFQENVGPFVFTAQSGTKEYRVVISDAGVDCKVSELEPVYLVTIDGDGRSDRSYDEITAAYEAGYVLQCNYKGHLLPFSCVLDMDHTFSGVVDSTIYNVTVRSNGCTVVAERTLAKITDLPTKVSELENDSGYLTRATVEVTVTQDEDGNYTAELGSSEILQKHNAGYAVCCRLMNRVLALQMVSAAFCSFRGVQGGMVYTVSVGNEPKSPNNVTVTTSPLSDGTTTGAAVLYTPQTLTEDQKAQARANIGASAEGTSGGSNAFKLKVTLEEDVKEYSFSLPTTFDKLLQFHVFMHAEAAPLLGEMEALIYLGNKGNRLGTLPVNTKALSVYGIYFAGSMFSVGVNKSTNASGVCQPIFPNETAYSTLDANTLKISSNTDDVKFRAGTTFFVWGVYAP